MNINNTQTEIVISVNQLTKSYQIYDAPTDRLKQIFWGWRKNYYREFFALRDINFVVPKGQSIGIIGRNGAGKSTLLQILTGTLTPTQGSVNVTGKVAAVLELGAGFNPEFTGRENIYLYASLFALKKTEIEDRFEKIVQFSELSDFIDQPVKTYSSGMQARLAFSVIAHVDADILIIDEALSVGDAFFAQKCMRFLRKFQENGTILFVSHDLAAVTNFCDQAIWLESGQIRDIGSAKLVCEKYFAQMYMENTGADLLVKSASEDQSIKTLASTKTVENLETIQSNVADKVNKKLSIEKQYIESFGFNAASSSFGTNEAEITEVKLTDENGNELAICEGGVDVVVTVMVKAHHAIDMPIIGFIIKDRLGQHLIGGNTFHSFKNQPVRVNEGEYLQAQFYFKLPILAIGDYSIVAAIANGTLQQHVQLHWLHDALFFKVLTTSIDGVMVGVPLDKVIMNSMSIN